MGKHLIILILFAVLFGSCQSDAFEDRIEGVDPDCDEVSFSANVKPILDLNCTISGCHNGDQFPDLTEFQNVQTHSAEIRQRVLTRNMPIGRTLTSNQVNTIICWIDNGVQDN